MYFSAIRRPVGPVVCVIVSLAGSSALAISIRHDTPVADYNNLAQQSQYAAVGYLADDQGELCTGTLVGASHVLTASHCVDDDSDGVVDPAVNLGDLAFGFGNNVPANATPNIASAAINPQWATSGGDPAFDVAVLTLSSPITSVTPASITDQNPASLVGTMIGYGEQGFGDFFPDNIPGANDRLAARNLIDAANSVVQTDFDSSAGNSSTLGSSTPLTLEGTTGPGDSGGPIFAEFNGVALIVGTLNGGANALPNGFDSEYGDVSDWAALRNAQNLAFLAGFGIVPFTPNSGDFDNDGDVDGRDLLVWQRGNPPSQSDLADWQANFGNGANPFAAASTAVPEPSTVVTLLFGVSTFPSRRVRIARSSQKP